MANLIALATGNFSAAGSWGTADTTMVKVNGTTSTLVTTGNLETASYTPGIITVDGVLLNISLRVASPTGTMTVTLRNQTLGADVTAVTINNTDLPTMTTSADAPGGWVFFKFSASQVLLAATAYRIRITSSVANQCALYAGASNDWNIVMRTTTTAAPGAADRLFIQGEKTSAGATTALAITMDNNAATDFGKIDVTDQGTLIYSIAGDTQLRTSGNLDVWSGGILNIGTVASPVPIGTAAILEFDCSSNVEFGLEFRAGSTVTIQGGSRSVAWSYLTADAAGGATSLTINDSVGSNWKNGDSILIASTTRTASQTEVKALSADGSGTTLTIAAIANAHSGTSPTQAEVGNLTRNITLRSTGASSWYIRTATTASVDIDWAEIIDIGSATTSKRGMDINTTTGSFNLQYSVIRDNNTASSFGAIFTSTAANNAVISNCIYYNNIADLSVSVNVTTGVQITNNLFAANTSTATASVAILGHGLTFSNNRIFSGAATSVQSVIFTSSTAIPTAPTISGNIVHSCAGGGCQINGYSGTVGISSYRNTGVGIILSLTASAGNEQILVVTGSVFGNATTNIDVSGFTSGAQVTLSSCTVNSDASFTTANGLNISGTNAILNLVSCSFGATTTHTTADVVIGSSTGLKQLTMWNTTLTSATEVSGQANLGLLGFIRSSRHDTTAGAYKAWFVYGTVEYDTSVFNTASPSEKMTATSSSRKLKSALKYAPLNSGEIATVSVYIRKNAGYTGNQPQLVVVANPSAGINSDTVLATYSASTGSWNQISGATAAVTEDCVLAFYVDCDTGGSFINVDDWDITIA